MKSVYKDIRSAVDSGKKLLAVLIDPDKFSIEKIPDFIAKVNASVATHIFVGGSTVEDEATHVLVEAIKTNTLLPVVLFPGDVTQITPKADALLFLSLISGRNPEYLIGKHVGSVSKLRNLDLEVIPTGYLLIENGKETAVQRVTATKPMSRADIQHIVDTAKAGEFLGMKLIYLEAGSGAIHPITTKIISSVKADLKMPLIVGGGIRTKKQLESAYNAGADIVVIGTAFEQDESFFNNVTIS
ncbi:geranylgeranylglyceryl/heptaprenylglyceryl phosphate synthase [Aestuariibaculum sp. YM273]|uniref:geranylgeranylglyceryl/heptaprenylglyceryl phosphate synthase n=1 Tax=Aestuariibaculum sp. YM273 TaxID=3070659 RepID=UPI0027DEA75B|nr:geranylgeranylglyceryl/heptaprenylglyceryl phosphate synthase [Aestuariibaculum sp. YM273]WMI66409.1 geranylgeranylglyceryl/heptaprenylglyceryl phosphate synthase [Aestuariibaculum sp. YM273]